MKLETIYKRTSTGKVQEWTVEVEDDKFRTISGQVDGKKVTSEWTIAKGKNTGKANATTGAEQALKEATAKRRLKLEGEYKESPEDIDTLDFKEPLLAKDYKEYRDDLVFPFWSQPKLDGVRCIVRADGMYSRNGKPIVAAPHIIDSLRAILKQHPHLEFDGELYNHGLKDNFDKIISLVRRGKPTIEDFAESKKIVEYWIYDIRDSEKTFSERYVFIRDLFLANQLEHPCVFVPTAVVKDQDELDDLYAYYQVEGFEGQMVRLDDAGYEFKRSKNLLKRKEFIDEEFTILDIEEGTGNRSGMAGFMRFETKDRKPFKANMRGGVEQYTEWLVNKELYIGKQATVRYQNLTPDGIPRFPVVIAVRDYE